MSLNEVISRNAIAVGKNQIIDISGENCPVKNCALAKTKVFMPHMSGWHYLVVEVFDQTSGRFRRTIVSDDQFKITQRLGRISPQHFLQRKGRIVRANDYSSFHLT